MTVPERQHKTATGEYWSRRKVPPPPLEKFKYTPPESLSRGFPSESIGAFQSSSRTDSLAQSALSVVLASHSIEQAPAIDTSDLVALQHRRQRLDDAASSMCCCFVVVCNCRVAFVRNLSSALIVFAVAAVVGNRLPAQPRVRVGALGACVRTSPRGLLASTPGARLGTCDKADNETISRSPPAPAVSFASAVTLDNHDSDIMSKEEEALAGLDSMSGVSLAASGQQGALDLPVDAEVSSLTEPHPAPAPFVHRPLSNRDERHIRFLDDCLGLEDAAPVRSRRRQQPRLPNPKPRHSRPSKQAPSALLQPLLSAPDSSHGDSFDATPSSSSPLHKLGAYLSVVCQWLGKIGSSLKMLGKRLQKKLLTALEMDSADAKRFLADCLAPDVSHPSDHAGPAVAQFRAHVWCWRR